MTADQPIHTVLVQPCHWAPPEMQEVVRELVQISWRLTEFTKLDSGNKYGPQGVVRSQHADEIVMLIGTLRSAILVHLGMQPLAPPALIARLSLGERARQKDSPPQNGSHPDHAASTDTAAFHPPSPLVLVPEDDAEFDSAPESAVMQPPRPPPVIVDDSAADAPAAAPEAPKNHELLRSAVEYIRSHDGAVRQTDLLNYLCREFPGWPTAQRTSEQQIHRLRRLFPKLNRAIIWSQQEREDGTWIVPPKPHGEQNEARARQAQLAAYLACQLVLIAQPMRTTDLLAIARAEPTVAALLPDKSDTQFVRSALTQYAKPYAISQRKISGRELLWSTDNADEDDLPAPRRLPSIRSDEVSPEERLLIQGMADSLQGVTAEAAISTTEFFDRVGQRVPWFAAREKVTKWTRARQAKVRPEAVQRGIRSEKRGTITVWYLETPAPESPVPETTRT